MYVAPSVHAEPETVDFTYTVVNKANPSGQGDTMSLPFGAHTSIDFSGLEGEFGYYVHNGQLIESAVQAFTISGSTNLIVVMKENAEDIVASFVDTNGEFLGAVYNPETEPTVAVSVSKPGYNFTGFGETSSLEDAVYVAQYSRINQGLITVNVVGGTKDLEEVKYNDVVTLSPNSGNFSYWADEDGQVVSRNANYAFSALQDVELTAVFDQPESDAPVVYLSNVTGISPDNQSFLGYIEGDFVEYGLLASKEAEVLTVDSVGVEVIPSTSLHLETNEFLRSIPEELEYTTFRAYAKLANGDVVYSDNNYYISFGQPGNNYHEKFDNVPTSNAGSYSTRVFNGVHNNEWTANNARTDQTITGKAITVRNNTLITTLDSGISSLEFKHKQGFSDAGATIEIYINEVKVGETILVATTVNTYSISGLQFLGEVELKLVTKERVVIDDLVWTGFIGETVSTKLYGVEFNNEGETSIIAVQANQLLDKPENPNKEGFAFEGWYTAIDGGEKFDFESTVITKHLKLFARYEELEQHTVSFDLNEGTGLFEDQRIYDGDFAIEPIAVPEHDTLNFIGWYTSLEDGELFDFETTPIVDDIILYARYTDTVDIPEVVIDSGTFVGKADLPTGWSHSGLGSDYKAPAPLKFDNTGDSLTSETFELQIEATVSIFVRSNGTISGTSKLEILDQDNNVIHTFVPSDFPNQNNNGTLTFIISDLNVTRITLKYTKGSGNLGVGSVKIEHNIPQ